MIILIYVSTLSRPYPHYTKYSTYTPGLDYRIEYKYKYKYKIDQHVPISE